MSHKKNILLTSPDLNKRTVVLEEGPFDDVEVPDITKPKTKARKIVRQVKNITRQAKNITRQAKKLVDKTAPFVDAIVKPAGEDDSVVEELKNDINAVAATRAFINNQKVETRNDQIGILEKELEAIYDKLKNENDKTPDAIKIAAKVTGFEKDSDVDFKTKYYDPVVSFYEKPIWISTVYPIQALTKEFILSIISRGVRPGIKTKIEEILKSVEADVSPTEISDIADASGDYLEEAFLSFVTYTKDNIVNNFNTNHKSCAASHPFATLGAALHGTAYGGFQSKPFWTKMLSMSLTPVTAPLKTFRTIDKTLSLTDKVPIIGPIGKFGRYAGYAATFGAASAVGASYLAIPDDAEEANKLSAEGEDLIDGIFGPIDSKEVPAMFLWVFEALNFGMEKARPFAKDVLDASTSEILMTKNELNKNIISKINNTTQKVKDREEHMSSMNCYLSTLAGAFILSNLANVPLKRGAFALTKGLDSNLNKFKESIMTVYRQTRVRYNNLFKLKEGNDLAAYLALRNVVNNDFILSSLGEIKLAALNVQPRMAIFKSADQIASDILTFNARLIPQEHRNKFKAYIVNDKININLKNANEQLSDMSTPVFERAMDELSSSIREVYRTGPTIERIRRLAMQSRGITNGAEAIMSNYRSTAGLIKNMMTKNEAGILTFERRLNELDKRYKRIRQALTSTQIASGDIIKAINKFEDKNPTTVATMKSIAPYLDRTDVKVDQWLRSIPGSGGTRYDALIRDVREIDRIEKAMIAEVRMIDEMFKLEKKMIKKFGALPEGTPKTFDQFLKDSTDPGITVQIYRKFQDLARRFNRFIETNPQVNIMNRRFMGFSVRNQLDYLAYIIPRMAENSLLALRSVSAANLRNTERALRENPKFASSVISASAMSLYNFIEATINFLESTIKEEIGTSDNFVLFLRLFLEDIRTPSNMSIGADMVHWKKWVRKFKSEKEIPKKLNILFTLFKKINNNQIKENRIITMKKTELEKLVSEMLNENSGSGYSNYPYASNEPSEEEPNEDYLTEWNSLVDEICTQKKRVIDGDPDTVEDTAIEVAKLFIRDLELFREVLEMAGSNKSVGVEIMSQLKSAKER